jgi:luciferase family oxidoreductase group 1
MSLPLSVLDLAPIPTGISPGQALRNMIELARHVERLGYTRYWLAEHHNMPGVASTTPELLIGQVARATTRLRVGSGGVMLPNHAPLRIVEAFRLLEALFPGRVDLGIGRAPGTDGLTALALRRSREALSADDFPEQLAELFAFATGQFPPEHPFRSITAGPSEVPLPPVWLLGSSDYSARLAAELGLGFAFASHINPADATPAMRLYREQFRPSAALAEPWAILAAQVICAESDARADELATSVELAILRLRTGRPSRIPSPAEAMAYPYTAAERELIHGFRAGYVIGGPALVHDRLTTLVEQTAADELMAVTTVHDHAERLRSYALLAEIFELRPAPVAAADSSAG